MIDELKNNVQKEKKIVSDIVSILGDMQNKTGYERASYLTTLNALVKQLEIINESVPALLEEISPFKALPTQSKSIVKLSYNSKEGQNVIALNKKDKEAFIKELNLSEINLKKISEKESKDEVQKPSKLARISNKVFSRFAIKIAPGLKDVDEDMKKANIRFLLSTYISMALFVSSVIFALSFILIAAIIIFNFSYITWIWTPFAAALLSLVLFYIYPSMEKGSFRKDIEQELPFAVIHMSAIAGSNVEPYKIFKIISLSKEYPHLSFEIRKMVNQIDFYGLDLVTALKNAAKTTSSVKLAELYSGLATNISTGGNIKDYLEKKSENLLLDYKLEREKATEIAGTFMNIYISVVIVAPLILMILFIIMNVSNLGLNVGIDFITIITVSLILLINIIFLIVLNIKQPKA
jgi:Flp pilus assembly protein TadB